MPATENTPFFSVTVPVEVVPSPQLIVAVKSPTAAFGLASVNVATVAVTDAPSVALIGIAVAVSAASATVAVLDAVAVLPPTSVMMTLTGTGSLSASA